MEAIKRFFSFERLSAKFCGAAFLALGAALLAFPKEVQEATLSSVIYCLTVLVPSLFPFMALTSFAVTSGAGIALSRVLGFLSRYVFRLPKVCTASLLMSFLGGYPAGARGVSLLWKQGSITREQAGRMMLFCVNPGIAFVVTFLGGTVLGSFSAGWLLFLSVTAAGILLGVFTGLFAKFPEEKFVPVPAVPGGTVIRSAVDACSGILKMSACVVLFSGFTAILHGSGLYQFFVKLLSGPGPFSQPEAAAALSFFIEVTGGVGDAAKFQVSPLFYAFGLAFAGLCVHLQVFSFFEEFPVSKCKFFLFRFLHGFLAAGIYSLLSRVFPSAVNTAVLSGSPVAISGGLSATVAGALSLLLLCSAFLLLLGRDCETRQTVIK